MFRWLAVIVLVLVLAAVGLIGAMVLVPGSSYEGEVRLTGEGEVELAGQLEADVRMLAEEIGERNVFHPERLQRAVAFIERELAAVGLEAERQTYEVRGVASHNIEAELEGSERPEEIIIIGAHYDSVLGSPGANDNGSGVAALLALARRFAEADPARSLRFVFFVNEEPPFFLSPEMGSVVYAGRSAEHGEDIRGMVSLETIGYYDDQPKSQTYPIGMLDWIYPDQGDFIAFVSNLRSRSLLRAAVGAFREETRIPSEGASLPGFIPGVGWSDHWAFWQEGYSAIMLTDTAPFRYPYYHTAEDTWDRLDYERLALVVRGFEPVVEHLAGIQP